MEHASGRCQVRASASFLRFTFLCLLWSSRFPWAVSHYLKGGFNYQDGGLAAATAPFEDWEAEYRKEPCTQRETNEPLWIRPSRECTNGTVASGNEEVFFRATVSSFYPISFFLPDPPGNLVGVNSDWEVPAGNQQTVLPECLPDEPRLYKGEPVPEFHQFPLKREDIVFVDTRAAYLAALDELAKEVKYPSSALSGSTDELKILIRI